MEQTQNTALLVMDMSVAILRNLPDPSAIIKNVNAAITAARSNKIPIIYIVVAFRPGSPEINMNNKSFGAMKERFANTPPEDFLEVHPDVIRQPDEIVCIKRRISAFTGSDLEVILRAKGIQHMVLTGVSTSGVVLSTTREAADKDYRLTILSDCCWDADEEVHRVLTTKIFVRQAEVTTVGDWGKV